MRKATKTSSRKSKGRRLQKEIASQLSEFYKKCQEKYNTQKESQLQRIDKILKKFQDRLSDAEIEYLKEKISEVFLTEKERLFSHELKDEDIVSNTMGESGTDVKINSTLWELFPFDVEAKNQEKLNIWEAFRQLDSRLIKESKENSKLGILIFKRNYSDVYMAMKFKDFLSYLQNLLRL